jgi:hypothetical protein
MQLTDDSIACAIGDLFEGCVHFGQIRLADVFNPGANLSTHT